MLFVSEHTSLSYSEVKALDVFEFFKILTVTDERHKNRSADKHKVRRKPIRKGK